jgi:chemotaxis protein methyltransferase CheR
MDLKSSAVETAAGGSTAVPNAAPLAASTPAQIADIELQLLLEAIVRVNGYDFRNYAATALRRRVAERVRAEGLETISGLQEKVLHDPFALERLVQTLSMNPTSLFREPEFFSNFRTRVIPMLRTFPFLRIWCIGASRGEDAYSLAILLHEEGLYKRCKIYATEPSTLAVEEAKLGRLPIDMLEELAHRYTAAGGSSTLMRYVRTNGDSASLDPSLISNMVFARYHVATDSSFNEFHVIIARNVLPYFNRTLAYRVHGIVFSSLVRFGYLGLGERETLRNTPHHRAYQEVGGAQGLYRRVR